MQKISITTHRGRPCFRYFVGRRARYKVIRNPENPEPERIQLMAELLNGPKERKTPRPKAATLDQHIQDYIRELTAELGEKRLPYIEMVEYRIRRVFAAAKITALGQITAAKVKVAVAEMRKRSRKPVKKQKPADQTNPLSEQSRNFYRQSVKQFCRWATRTKRLTENPVADLKLPKVRTRPHRRDRLQVEELATLLNHTKTTARVIESISGTDRTLLYLVAMTTGLRRAELASITPACFLLDKQQIVVASGYTKNGREAVLPLHAAVLPLLEAKLAGLAPGEPLWPGLETKDAAKMLQADMVDCRLPVRTEQGIRAFHSLRNSFISMLLETTDVATAQRLARHCDVNLTLGYARLRPDSERKAIDKLDIPGL